jgi:hypothetical protein
MSSKLTSLRLKPAVFTLAKLLAMTSTWVCCERMPGEAAV